MATIKVPAPPTAPDLTALAKAMTELLLKSDEELKAYLDGQLGTGTSRLYGNRDELLKACQEQLAQEIAVQAARHAFRLGKLYEEQRLRLGLPKEVEDAIPDLTFKLEEEERLNTPFRQQTLEDYTRGLILQGKCHTEVARELVREFSMKPDTANAVAKMERNWLWVYRRRITLSGLSLKDPSLLQ